MKEKELPVQQAQEGWDEPWGRAEQTSFALHLPMVEPKRPEHEEPLSEAKGKEVEEDKQISFIQSQESSGQTQTSAAEEVVTEEEEFPPLEAIFEDIEEIVHHLETEEVSLEESLRLFEQGIRYCRWASRRLDEAENVIERLMRDPETGEETIEPWTEPGKKSSSS